MAFNGSGTYSLYATGNPVITGTTISSTWANNTLNDIATGLTTCITKNGQTTTTAVIPFAEGLSVPTGKSVTGAGTASITGFNTIAAATGIAVGGATPGAGGLAFPAVAVASADPNTLDDYEEGTWTPILGDGSGTISYTVQRGRFTKIGRLIFVQGEITINTISVAPTNNATIMSGLPFTVAATNYYRASAFTSGVNWGTGATMVQGYFGVGAAFVGLNGLTNDAAFIDITCNAVSNGDVIVFSGFYNV